MQRGDFEGIFKVMEGLPVTIRLLDPPLHEFLPQKDEEIAEVARAAGTDAGQAARPRRSRCTKPIPCWAIAAAGWASPIPEIYEMQARAILEAAAECGSRRAASPCSWKS